MESEETFKPQEESEPLISIIVPVRNMEKTIGRTLESIVDQSYRKIEILVIDGDSSDGTLERLAPYQNQLTLLVSEPDHGLYDAINKGLDRCSGSIVGILNGDDYYSHNNVLTLYEEKFRNADVGIVFGDLEFFSQHRPTKTIRSYSSKSFTPSMLQYGWMPPHPTTFVRKKIYDAIGVYRTDYSISSDFEFLVRALWLKSIKFDRVDSVVVRMQYGGLSTAGLRATYTLNREIIRACRSNGLDTNWLKLLPKFPKKLMEFLPIN